MKISVTLQNGKIRISEPSISDIYFIEQDENNNRFYIVSENGYNGYEGDGHKDLAKSINHVKNHLIKDYFLNRCEGNPKGW